MENTGLSYMNIQNNGREKNTFVGIVQNIQRENEYIHGDGRK